MANGSGNTTIMIVLVMMAVVVLLFGCQMGISFICNLTGGKKKGILSTPSGAIDLSTLTTTEVAALQEQLGVEEFPRVTAAEAMEYIANAIITDIDKGTYTQLHRNEIFELKAELLGNYKTDLLEIAEMNDMRLQPLEGRPLALYSRLLLELTRNNGIALAPATESAFKTNLFAGTPSPGAPMVTAEMAVRIA